MTFADFLYEVNHKLMGDFVSMSNDEINRFMKMEKLLENKIARRFKVRRLEKKDFGYLLEHIYGKTGVAYEDYSYDFPVKKLKRETLVKRYDLIRPARCLIEENQRYLRLESEDQTAYAAYFTINNIVAKLSRGGLYCHYGSTQEIFKEIINDFMSQQNDIFSEKIAKKQSAKKILEDVLEKYKVEMLDNQSSLSLAIYEYFSIKDNAETKNELYVQYLASFNAWQNLLEYGIKNGEFNNVDIKSVFDLIIFSYQGVRMYSKLMPIDEDIPQRIIEQIKKIIVKE